MDVSGHPRRLPGATDALARTSPARPAARGATALPPLQLLQVGMADLTEADSLPMRKAEPFLSAMLERARIARCRRRFGDTTVFVHKPPPTVERLPGGGR